MENGAVMTEEFILGAGGNKIFMRSWLPAGNPRAVMLIVPGFNSHSGYYVWVAEQLVASGLAVYAVDLRGRGKSEGERFYVEKFEDYVSDIVAMAQIAKSRSSGAAVYMFGHSAGGVVACNYAIDHQ